MYKAVNEWFDATKMLDNFTFWIDSPLYCVFVDDDVNGVIIGYATEYFFSHEMMAGDISFYIKPEKRGGILAARLIKAFTDWAHSMGAKRPMVGVSTGISPEMTGKLYERMGYTEKFAVYRKPAIV